MEIAEFERCINLGLGRAILYLQRHSSEPYREAILYACLHNTIYDRQLEHDKGQYIREIIRLSGEEAFYRQKILKAIKKRLDDRDLSHQLDILQCFAKEGDKEAKEIFYKIFNGTIKTNDVWCASRIIEIDGIEGFVHVAEKIIENKKENHDDFCHDSLLWNLGDEIGEELAQARLSELRTTNLKLNAYLKVLEAYRMFRQTKHRSASNLATREDIPSYEDLKSDLKSWGISSLWNWGEEADKEDLAKAAIDLEQETEAQSLKKYLAIFRYARYLRSPQKLIALTSHSDAQISHWSFEALANIESSEVREFALRVLDGEEKLGQAVSLLKVNFEEDDWEIIEAAIEKNVDPFENHYLQMNVREIARIQSSPKAVKSLLMLYEHGVCTICRYTILQCLASLNALHESIRKECFHDSNLDIREWAKKGFPIEKDDSLPKRN